LTVSGDVLRKRFGGIVIPHARDERFFDRRGTRDRAAARSELGLDPDEPVVVYVGTVRPHKGIRQLGTVASALDRGRLFVVGAADASLVPAPAVAISPVPYMLAMRWVAAADVVLVPQRAGSVGSAQVPAKLSDALAMGRAIVATDLPPIRAVVGEAAVLVPSDDTSLASAVISVIRDGGLRTELELRARHRFLQELSFRTVRPRMLDVAAAAYRRAADAA
jgi:glycosyltransferase involved in cell wall biosynthesis